MNKVSQIQHILMNKFFQSLDGNGIRGAHIQESTLASSEDQ